MTLKELLALRLIRDNVRISLFEYDARGLCKKVGDIQAVRLNNKIVGESDLPDLPKDWLGYQVESIAGSKDAYKTNIVIYK